MKQGRFNRLISSQSVAARKVYEAVPIQEDWDSMTINRELYRTGTKLNFTVVEGCLNTLTTAKLVKEVSRGRFRRIPVEAIPDEPDEQETTQEEAPMAQQPTKPKSAVDILASLASEANDIQVRLGQFKLHIESAAMTIMEMSEQESAELAELREWKNSLKKLIGG